MNLGPWLLYIGNAGVSLIGTADFISELQAAPLVDVFSQTPSHFLEVKFLFRLKMSVFSSLILLN